MKTIKHWTIKVTWSDGEEEFLDDIPYFKNVEYYLDQLEEEINEEEEEEEDEDE
tara:strand:- start:201 stop:362 length:162 start_codon:yes stop_codon:yes gene_type:complete